MKANLFLSEVAKKAGQFTPEFENKIAQLNTDLPDDVADLLKNIISIEGAKQNKDIGEHFRLKYEIETRNTEAGKLQALGIEGEEFDKIIALPPAQRLEEIHKRAEKLTREKLGKTETEAQREYEAKIAAEKERADRWQKATLQKEEDMRRAIESERANAMLKSFVDSAKINNVLPEDSARRLLRDEFLTRVASLGGQVVFRSDGKAVIAKADDPNTILHDARNNVVDANSVLNETVTVLKLKPQAQTKTDFPPYLPGQGGGRFPSDKPSALGQQSAYLAAVENALGKKLR